jgi:predicted transposase YdaD
MVGITKELRESRFYQDVKEEGKQEAFMQTIPMLLQAGLSIEDIVDRLKISITQVRQFAQTKN